MQQLTPLDYVHINIANAFETDVHTTWNSRIQRGKELILDAEDNMEIAKEPYLFMKGINSFHKAMAGKATGSLVSLDATASGMQIMAVMSGCEQTAKATNLYPTDKRECPYMDIAQIMGMGREDVKPATMTHFYGSKLEPEKAFPTKLPQFYSALDNLFPGAQECMEDMQSCWQPGMEHKWTMPDGHTVLCRNMDVEHLKLDIEELGSTISYIKPIQAFKKKGLSLAANIVHSVDGWIARELVCRAKALGFWVLPIHDCYFCHPNHMQKLRKLYMEILIEVSNRTMLQDILRQITGDNSLIYEKVGTLKPILLRNAEYAIS